MEQAPKKYIGRNKLVKREGWNGPAIKRLLQEPDGIIEATEEGKQDVQLFLASRVAEIETSGKLAKFNAKREENQAAKTEA